MTNGKTGAALVNRYPRTVMEAVLGLNSYLQNQFSALADIYMPIEGITESKPLQEFVYRLCPSSIKAKSVSLDRIYGKTLAWNQQFAHTYHADTQDGISCEVNNDGSLRFHGTSTSSGDFVNYYLDMTTVGIIAGHKYACVGWSENRKVLFAYTFGALTGTTVASGGAIVEGATTGHADAYIRLDAAGGASIDITIYPMMFDLTLMFGPGNEPSTVAEFEALFPGYHSYEPGKLICNDAESIETVGFNQFNANRQTVITTGAWDNSTPRQMSEDLIYKGITSNNYFYADNASFTQIENGIRVVGTGGGYGIGFPVRVFPNTEYCVSSNQIVNQLRIGFFDAGGNYLSSNNPVSTTDKQATFTTPANCMWVMLCLVPEPAATVDYENICINISDPAKNGTYEPYRKSTMQLNLGSFQVRDSQGNVTTITGCLKSAGSVRDEIVGNKYIKRVGSEDLGRLEWSYDSTYNRFIATLTGVKIVASSSVVFDAVCARYVPVTANQIYGSITGVIALGNNTDTISVKDSNYNNAATFTAAMDGVLLHYALATPEEYELVSPLVLSMKAGTTEARISPNADGLSAPMVADMTYDAQANNDSASAQYALTAGRLLNSHKLWGRDFDGTQDVAGALTGVTSITMNGALSGVTTLGVSGAATLGSTLSVAGNTTLSGTLGVSGLASLAGGLKLTTTKKIWFDDTHYIELLNGNLHTNLPVVSDSCITAGSAND